MTSAKFDYDLFIIGGGSGGVAAAKRAASYGVKVAIAESKDFGGTCVNRGCIAKRLMVYASDFPRHFSASKRYGWSECQSDFDWQEFSKAMHHYLHKLSQSSLEKLKETGIEVFIDRATLIDPHTVKLSDRQVTADKILIAVGGKPTRPTIPGIELALISDQMFDLEKLPQKIAIMGGGYIGVEFGSVLRNLGSEVTIIEANDRILDGFDLDIQIAVQQGMSDRGVQFFTGSKVKALEKDGDSIRVSIDGENCPETITADLVLCAIGRQPNLENLGLESAGVEVKAGAIAVDSLSRTSQPNIFAVGDCTDRLQLTPVAKAEGKAAIDTMFRQPQTIDYNIVPFAICARPEAASIGVTEAQAREEFGEAIECYRTSFEPLFHALSADETAQIKLIVDRNSDKVLGAHMVGDRAAEIIQTLTAAIKLGITHEQLQQTIGIHPTESEEIYAL